VSGGDAEFNAKVAKLVEMGFSEAQCRTALESNEFNEERAISSLLQG
jgi:hypothetical protein